MTSVKPDQSAKLNGHDPYGHSRISWSGLTGPIAALKLSVTVVFLIFVTPETSIALERPPSALQNLSVSTLMQMAQRGDANAEYALSIKFSEGKGVPVNDSEAYKWTFKAAQHGNPDAQCNLGAYYQYGISPIRKDGRRALAWELKAAKRGHCELQIAGLYQSGSAGLAPDHRQASIWWAKVAMRGNPFAGEMLGQMYEQGDGVPQDYRQAAAWYRVSAIDGDDSSMMFLGILYQRGLGVPQSNQMAYLLYQLSFLHSVRGDDAAQRRDEIGRTLTARQRQVAELLVAHWKVGTTLPTPSDAN